MHHCFSHSVMNAHVESNVFDTRTLCTCAAKLSDFALIKLIRNRYYDCEKYPLSPLKLRCLVLIKQYLPNISGPLYSCALGDINQHLIPSLLPMISKWWLIVTWSTHFSRGVSIDAFLSQWLWGQWFKEFVKYTSLPSFSSFIIERICGSVNCLAS